MFVLLSGALGASAERAFKGGSPECHGPEKQLFLFPWQLSLEDYIGAKINEIYSALGLELHSIGCTENQEYLRVGYNGASKSVPRQMLHLGFLLLSNEKFQIKRKPSGISKNGRPKTESVLYGVSYDLPNADRSLEFRAYDSSFLDNIGIQRDFNLRQRLDLNDPTAGSLQYTNYHSNCMGISLDHSEILRTANSLTDDFLLDLSKKNYWQYRSFVIRKQ